MIKNRTTRKFTHFMKNRSRLINGLISLCLFIFLYSIIDDVMHEGATRCLFQFRIGFGFLVLHLLQTVLNKTWINTAIKISLLCFLTYILIAFIYSFFDQNEVILNKPNGLLIKTIQTLLKIAAHL